METVKSLSVQWREEGNSKYKSVHDGLAPTVAKQRLEQATYFYQKAFNSAVNDEEKASAAKNLGMSNWKQAMLVRLDSVSSQNMTDVLYYMKWTFKHFSDAYQHGKYVKSQEWLDGVLNITHACWEEGFVNITETFDSERRSQLLFSFAQVVELDDVKAKVYFKIAECQFHRGITAIQNNDFKTCLHAMHECYMPLNEVLTLSTDDQLLSEVRVLQSDVFMHQCMAESAQAIAIGDSLLQDVVMQQEDLNIDLVWEVIDWFKQAILMTREITEVELEAIAVSRIGRVFDLVLKMPYRAKTYYKNAIELAHSMAPRSFVMKDWYVEARQTLEKYQQSTVSAEIEKTRQEEADIRKELEKEIKQLDATDNMSFTDFLTFIYKNFPPKNKQKNTTMPELKKISRENMKKVILQVLTQYHPDNVDVETHGKKWKFLSAEVTKHLNKRYTQEKLNLN